MSKPGLQVFGKESDQPEIALYDVVSRFYGVSARSFRAELRAIDKKKTVKLRINSPGGDVFEGNTIFNLIRDRGNVIVTVDGLAASIASVIAMAGDSVEIAKNAMMMIHNPWTITLGDTAEHKKAIELLDKVRDVIIGTYADKTGQDAKQLGDWMDSETWMSAETAVERGFADSVAGGSGDGSGSAENSVDCERFAACLAEFKSTPKELLERFTVAAHAGEVGGTLSGPESDQDGGRAGDGGSADPEGESQAECISAIQLARMRLQLEEISLN